MLSIGEHEVPSVVSSDDTPAVALASAAFNSAELTTPLRITRLTGEISDDVEGFDVEVDVEELLIDVPTVVVLDLPKHGSA